MYFHVFNVVSVVVTDISLLLNTVSLPQIIAIWITIVTITIFIAIFASSVMQSYNHSLSRHLTESANSVCVCFSFLFSYPQWLHLQLQCCPLLICILPATCISLHYIEYIFNLYFFYFFIYFKYSIYKWCLWGCYRIA